jgi:hypothetical protein
MRFPRIDPRGSLFAARTAFVLALDVELTSGQPEIADEHLYSGEKQFGGYWSMGVASLLKTKLAEKVVIVGGPEERHAGLMRSEALKSIVVRQHGFGDRIECLTSRPNTIGNLEAIGKWCHMHPRDHEDAFIACVFKQATRAANLTRAQGLDMAVVPLESCFLAEAKDENSRRLRCGYIYDSYGGGAYLHGLIRDINGIADMLCATYQSLSEKPERASSAA